MLDKFITFTSVPIIILNYLGGVIGGIWLLVLGEWKLVLFGFLATIVFPFVYGIVITILDMPFTWSAMYFSRKNKRKLMLVFAFLGITINNIINLTWVFWVLTVALTLGETGDTIPFLLYGYFVATIPFSYIAQKEDADSYGTLFGVYLVQFSYLVGAIFFLLNIPSLVLPAVLIVMLVLEINQLKIANIVQKAADADQKFTTENELRVTDEEYEEILDNELDEAMSLAIGMGYASPALFQRRLRISYEESMILLDNLEKMGVIEETDGAKPRRIMPKYSKTPYPSEFIK